MNRPGFSGDSFAPCPSTSPFRRPSAPRSGSTPSNQPLRHIPKAPAPLGKLGEGPFRHYLSLLQQYNPVTVPYRAQAVGDDDYRLLRAETLDGLHDCPLCDGVQGAGCFIKDQYGRVVVEGAGYSDALSLPTG